MTRDFEALVARCLGSVTIEANPHRDCYETVEAFWDDMDGENDGVPMDLEERTRILNGENLYRAQVYPDTLIGCYILWGTTFGEVVELAHKVLDDEARDDALLRAQVG